LSLSKISDWLTLPQNIEIMLSLNYLKSILFVNGRADIDGIDRNERILEARAGMDGAIQMIQNKDLPLCIVLEHAERHTLSMHNMGGFHECTQSIWLMERVASGEDAQEVMERCYARFRRLYSILIEHSDEPQLQGWIENNEVNAYAREAGDYVGFEIFVNFRENDDLSYAPRN